VNTICALLDRKSPRADGKSYATQITYVTDRPGHDRRYAIDATKINRELGWKPAETFATGIEKTVDWYLKNRAWTADITSTYARERLGTGVKDLRFARERLGAAIALSATFPSFLEVRTSVLNSQSLSPEGIILAGGSGTRLYPLTIAVSKQLMPVYDKPMVYYPAVGADARRHPRGAHHLHPDRPAAFKKLLGDGANLGLKLSYAEQPSPDGLAQAFHIAGDTGFLKGEPSALVLGDNLFYGAEFVNSLAEASPAPTGHHLRLPRRQSHRLRRRRVRPGRPRALPRGKAQAAEIQLRRPRPLFLRRRRRETLAKSLKPSEARGELEITDLNRLYLEPGRTTSTSSSSAAAPRCWSTAAL
jgi:glucose-1-phosphate thymidylyltransferase